MTTAQVQGNLAEDRAVRFLADRGLTLIGRNYRIRQGEIDLVCRDGGVTVFVEVRSRSRQDFGGAAASINAVKQRRLIAAARHWLARHGERPCRFDCVLIDGTELTWLENAFTAD